MAEDLDKPRETSEQIATRKWNNNQLRQKIVASKVSAPVVVDPKAPPEIATVIKNKAKRLRGGFETRFLKEIRSMLDERKRENYKALVAHVTSYRRKLMLEKLRRYQLAEREDAERENAEWDAQRRNATKSRDLFA
jgi:hypothetical protein